jgi:hypothetical protein
MIKILLILVSISFACYVYFKLTNKNIQRFDTISRINPGFGTQLGKYQVSNVDVHNNTWFNAMEQKQGQFSKYIEYLQNNPKINAMSLLSDPYHTPGLYTPDPTTRP